MPQLDDIPVERVPTVRRSLPFIILLTLFAIPAAGNVILNDRPIHLDKGVVTGGCAACHYRSYLKSGGGSTHCLYCHGSGKRRGVKPAAIPFDIIPKGITPKDVEKDLAKLYHHPVLESPGVHRANEQLPEVDPKTPRHAECVDCHNPHHLNPVNKFAGIPGQRVGTLVSEATEEKDVCYRCHAESANLPPSSTNKRIEFSKENPSFHPVEEEGKNLAVVSLIRPYRERKTENDDISRITCSSCHGSDDPGGSRGPHGSNTRHILNAPYSTEDLRNESELAYALCYRCHSRQSILANESFRYHSLHIQGKDHLGNQGTSCSTCHSPHGSTEYRYLIRFNRSVVSPTRDGKLKFVERGTSTFSGECYLTCHGVEHNPKGY